MKKTLFLILSGAIVIFSIICIGSSPIINKVYIEDVFEASDWAYLNCKMLSDSYKLAKDLSPLTGDARDQLLKPLKRTLNLCNRRKAIIGLEYSSLIIDVILAFLCLILGLLHYFDVGKPFEKVTGIIGLATGIIQFVLTLVYVCYSGYIFTNDVPDTKFPKVDKDGIFATWDDSQSKYKCDFYDKDDENAVYAKYSDLGKRAYNYDKDIEIASSTDTVRKCQYSSRSIGNECNSETGYFSLNAKQSDCGSLYIKSTDEVQNKYLYDRWVTTIVFACFIFVCDIGLAIFGFLLFKSDGSGL